MDAVASDLMQRVDYDVLTLCQSKGRPAFHRFPACQFDLATRDFLTANPQRHSCRPGVRFDARFERIETACHWFGLDLPEVIGFRKQLIQDSPRNTG